jgi:hypothetical protein
MAKFRCLISGNIVEFTQAVDIDSMVGHEGYERVIEAGEQVEHQVELKPLPLMAPTPSKPRGRPAKVKQ